MNYVFFDLETQNLFDDVGGRDNIEKLKLACAVTFSTAKNDFSVYWEQDVSALLAELRSATKVIGFNLLQFDYKVLQPYAPQVRLASIPTLDMMLDLQKNLGFRVGLDNLAGASLGAAKTADGIQSVEWFRKGELDKVAEYCKADVDITRRVFEFGRDNGFVYYKSKLGSKLKSVVKWK
ncbi:MAG: ribonuclease H-like domain-containing protein [Anaerolineales bacterium]|jgi:DEAD/DEAH box helicase domain-containing protein|uniref:ribonuclease H-like domain-containing protein n=1 Tax=Candidatus Villigracilis vicinus TaxID=3140679 RepID=UPI00313612B2|nr:ribonuclease H-like domain-containing protein [Anaerolineales bacterium]MBK7448010.1 ribonuclease H-like domain-containing protein [Anaerolineales bacterium]MBK9778889.1 ribonuclease H-like domain-containing protein [Anaerolineales bacterium]